MNKLLLTALLLTSFTVQAECVWSTVNNNGYRLHGDICDSLDDKHTAIIAQLLDIERISKKNHNMILNLVRCNPYLHDNDQKWFCEVTLDDDE